MNMKKIESGVAALLLAAMPFVSAGCAVSSVPQAREISLSATGGSLVSEEEATRLKYAHALENSLLDFRLPQ